MCTWIKLLIEKFGLIPKKLWVQKNNDAVTFPRYLTYSGWQTNEYYYLSFSTLTTDLASYHKA